MLGKGAFLLVLTLLRLIVLFPYRTQMRFGRRLGRVAFKLAKKRRHIARVNLSLCFPELSDAELDARVLQAFESVGMGLIEIAMAWFMSERRFQKIPVHIKGEQVLSSLDPNRGIMILSGHFTCLELIGRACSQHYSFHVIYKAQRNAAVQKLLLKKRQQYYKSIISHRNLKQMVKSLKKGEIVWYAPDQDFGRHHSVFAPFMGVETASLSATTKLANWSNAQAVTCFFHRLPNDAGYQIDFGSALPGFPSGDEVQDATLYNNQLSDYVTQHPMDYFWVHRRFKTRAEGQASVY